MIECGSCGTQNPDELYVCRSCGARLASPERLPDDAREATVDDLRSAVQRLVAARLAEGPSYGAVPPALPTLPAIPTFRLVALDGDGADGTAYPLDAGTTDIGRTTGDLLFDDPFLADRHARVLISDERTFVRALEPHNGIFRRLRGPVELMSGDRILIGEQVLRFEILAEAETAATSALENGVAVFGSRVRPAWGRLLQMAPAGVPRDVFHLARGEILIGRERTDVVFSDDARVSPTHARVMMRAGRAVLEDLRSKHGTFLGVRGAHELEPGDVIRMGDQVFRFERNAP